MCTTEPLNGIHLWLYIWLLYTCKQVSLNVSALAFQTTLIHLAWFCRTCPRGVNQHDLCPVLLTSAQWCSRRGRREGSGVSWSRGLFRTFRPKWSRLALQSRGGTFYCPPTLFWIHALWCGIREFDDWCLVPQDRRNLKPKISVQRWPTLLNLHLWQPRAR